MTRKRLGILAVLSLMTVIIVSGLILPTRVDATVTPGPTGGGWRTYAVNHPDACVGDPWDCYVIWIWAS